MRHALLALTLLALSTPLAGAQHAGHHAAPASDSLDVPTSLSAAEFSGLFAGAGLGMAKPAELSGYPGPLHVLELAAELDLTDEQRATAQALRAEMLARAVPLGSELVGVERHLDAVFASGAVTAERVARMTAHAARLRGELRAAHLSAHLGMRDALRPEQITRYAELRGYTTSGGEPRHR